jgi:catechol 2,3-dioxygenase-like lactoylglutathione lyase family enzyme
MPEARMARVAVHAGELRLDHVSIAVPDFADAVGRLDERLGLQVTVSPQAPERHGRVYLDRAYLEVAAHPGSPAWAATSFFLRFPDPQGLRAHLDAVQLGHRYRVYEGVDGRWDDVELDVADVPVPILVRRTEPPQLARNWPPPLHMPHRCGAVTLAAVHLPVPSTEEAAEVYARLLNVEAPVALSGPGPRRRAVFHLSSATIMLVEGGERRAVVLGVTSLDMSRAVLSAALLPPDREGVAWLDPSATSGLAIGLAEIHGSVPIRSPSG